MSDLTMMVSGPMMMAIVDSSKEVVDDDNAHRQMKIYDETQQDLFPVD